MLFCSFLLLDVTLYYIYWYNYLYWFIGHFVYIVSVYTYNVYYVRRALILKLWYNIPNFYFTGLNGQSDRASLKSLCINGFGLVCTSVLVSFWYYVVFGCIACIELVSGVVCVCNAWYCLLYGYWTTVKPYAVYVWRLCVFMPLFFLVRFCFVFTFWADFYRSIFLLFCYIALFTGLYGFLLSMLLMFTGIYSFYMVFFLLLLDFR